MSVFLPVGLEFVQQSATLGQKLDDLRRIVREMKSVVVGFSGGADSALLCRIAHDELGNRALAAMALSESYPRREKDEAIALAESIGIDLRMVSTSELANESYASNPTNRCYYCKKELFVHLAEVAREHGANWIAYGANHDDLSDYRPGALAATEFGVRAPLVEAGFSKPEIRHISKQLGLSTWDKPAMACLSSRIPHGTRITAGLLSTVEQAEEFLRYELGFRQVRVRHHGEIARIEIASGEMNRLLEPDLRSKISEKLKGLGYRYVAMELIGFRSGSLNPADSH